MRLQWQKQIHVRKAHRSTYLGAVEGGTDLGGTEGKTHVAGVGGGDGVHGQTTSLVGGGGEGGLGVNIDGGAHLHGGGGLRVVRGRRFDTDREITRDVLRKVSRKVKEVVRKDYPMQQVNLNEIDNMRSDISDESFLVLHVRN